MQPEQPIITIQNYLANEITANQQVFAIIEAFLRGGSLSVQALSQDSPQYAITPLPRNNAGSNRFTVADQEIMYNDDNLRISPTALSQGAVQSYVFVRRPGGKGEDKHYRLDCFYLPSHSDAVLAGGYGRVRIGLGTIVMGVVETSDRCVTLSPPSGDTESLTLKRYTEQGNTRVYKEFFGSSFEQLDYYKQEANLVAQHGFLASKKIHDDKDLPHNLWLDVDGYLCMTMRNLGRQTLADFLRLPLSLEQRWLLAFSLLKAYTQLNEDIAHLDLKPQNIMINENGELTIVDFGLAKQVGAETDMIGTLGYTPFEARYYDVAVTGQGTVSFVKREFELTVTKDNDSFSLGQMLWEIFAGLPPYHLHQLIQYLDDDYTAMTIDTLRQAESLWHDNKQLGFGHQQFSALLGLSPDVQAGLNSLINDFRHPDPQHRINVVQAQKELQRLYNQWEGKSCAVTTPDYGSALVNYHNKFSQLLYFIEIINELAKRFSVTVGESNINYYLPTTLEMVKDVLHILKLFYEHAVQGTETVVIDGLSHNLPYALFACQHKLFKAQVAVLENISQILQEVDELGTSIAACVTAKLKYLLLLSRDELARQGIVSDATAESLLAVYNTLVLLEAIHRSAAELVDESLSKSINGYLQKIQQQIFFKTFDYKNGPNRLAELQNNILAYQLGDKKSEHMIKCVTEPVVRPKVNMWKSLATDSNQHVVVEQKSCKTTLQPSTNGGVSFSH
ncbi:MAG: hypothetical protein CMF50_00650 [Legionellales bacterium]|nr:hypothetical protein [Legionellales bacterium]|tara:strand:- start:13295 stop:15490 length:2196 start_codon:yes stop_codon:yes gene_type:complete